MTSPSATQDVGVPEAATTVALKWWVVHTKPRQEKALADDLTNLQVDHFLPLQQSVRYYGKRKFRVELPLFSGYLFLNASPDQAISADRTGRVASLIKVADQDRIAAELRAIRLALEQGADLSVSGMIKSGDTVEVTSGPFKGLRGIVDRSGPQGRLLLGVHLIERAAVLEIDHALLKRVD